MFFSELVKIFFSKNEFFKRTFFRESIFLVRILIVARDRAEHHVKHAAHDSSPHPVHRRPQRPHP